MREGRIGKFFYGGLILLLISSLSEVQAKEERIVARVNGVAISYQALREAVAQRVPPGTFHGAIPPENVDRIAHEALEELILGELQVQAAKKMGLKIAQADIRAQLEQVKKSFPSPKQYQEALKGSGISEKELQKKIERALLLQKVQQKEIQEKAQVIDQELRDYYDKNRKQFLRPESARVRQLLIGIDPGSSRKTWEEGEKRSREMLQRIKKGEDFASLAKQFSTDAASKEKGGDLGFIHRGRLSPEVENLAFSLKVGEVGGPIRSIYGFHLIKLEGNRPSVQLEFSQVDKNLLRNELLKGKQENRRKEWTQALKKEARIEVFEDQLGPLIPQ